MTQNLISTENSWIRKATTYRRQEIIFHNDNGPTSSHPIGAANLVSTVVHQKNYLENAVYRVSSQNPENNMDLKVARTSIFLLRLMPIFIKRLIKELQEYKAMLR